MANSWSSAGDDAIDGGLNTQRSANCATNGGTGESSGWSHCDM
jgi:hypothetical protein